jgi:hypothetical protein
MRDSGATRPPESPEAVSQVPTPVSPVSTVPFTPAGIEGAWPAILADARLESPFLGEALAAARPVAVVPPELSVEIQDANPLILERLHRQRDRVEALISRHVGGPVTLKVSSGTPLPDEADRPRSRRMSDSGAKAERLKTLRKKDPALDAAADELDLEIVD